MKPLIDTSMLRVKDVGKTLTFQGQIHKLTKRGLKIIETKWECQECGDKLYMPVEDDVKKPIKCNCGSRRFRKIGHETVDYREFYIKDLRVELNGDIAMERLPKDGSVKVTGVLNVVPRTRGTRTRNYGYFLEAQKVDL